jgi:DnaJ-class molecular chaperone
MTYQLKNGEEWQNGKLYGWTGKDCPKCQGHGIDNENWTCGACGGTGEEWGLMPEQPK